MRLQLHLNISISLIQKKRAICYFELLMNQCICSACGNDNNANPGDDYLFLISLVAQHARKQE